MPKPKNEEEIGSTLDFVVAQGFVQVENQVALATFDGTRRVFIELSADVDRPNIRPAAAYEELLNNLQIGWSIRFLQTYWHDPGPRMAFLERMAEWNNRKQEGLDILFEGLAEAARGLPLPYLRRTFLEYVLPGEQGLSWWESLPGTLGEYGLQARHLGAQEIQELAYRILNPGLSE